MVREFIEGWDLIQVLGEGTFGEVKLLVNKENGEACAMKEINLDSSPEAEDIVKKEICVHKLLKHKHIIQCYGSRLEGRRQFIFLEYCTGGELFDRIDPDKGMPEWVAQKYFNALTSAVEYLHKKGVSHRDIKPENILLSENDILKLSDFGMATVFRHQGVERLLERRCGTLPYIAPELLSRNQYHAEPADIWSCGIVLVTMLTGELPWDKPTSDQPEYMIWKDQHLDNNPWNKIDHLPQSLLRKILMPHPSRRFKIEQIKNHVWLKKKFKEHAENNGAAADGSASPLNRSGSGPTKKRLLSHIDFPVVERVLPPGQSSSQPAPCTTPESGGGEASIDSNLFHGFTQPAQMDNLLLLSTQAPATQGSQSPFQKLVKRMTRFWVSTDKETTEKVLREILVKSGYTCKMITPGILTVQIVDTRNMVLVFKVTLIEMDKKILLDFRRSRGCGIEFKRRFTKLKASMEQYIEKGPIMWSLAINSDALPGV